MSLKPSQLIIAGLAGFGTALGIALATIQPQNSPQPEAVNPPQIEPTAPIPNPSISPVSTSNPPEESTADRVLRTSPIPKQEPIVTRPAPSPAIPKEEPVVTTPAPSPTPAATAKGEPVVVTAPETGCQIRMARIDDPNPPINVRSVPEATDDKSIVGQLKNNTFVSVAEEEKGWLRITDPIPGWIAKNKTQSSCSQVTERIRFSPGGTEAIVKGRMIGGGSHRYLLNAGQGQTLIVTNHQQQKVFPTILTPDGKVLAGHPYEDSQRMEWTGQLPTTGDYTFEFDSNYKGFEYEFSIEVN